jgi:hypothetical protein
MWWPAICTDVCAMMLAGMCQHTWDVQVYNLLSCQWLGPNVSDAELHVFVGDVCICIARNGWLSKFWLKATILIIISIHFFKLLHIHSDTSLNEHYNTNIRSEHKVNNQIRQFTPQGGLLIQNIYKFNWLIHTYQCPENPTIMGSGYTESN